MYLASGKQKDHMENHIRNSVGDNFSDCGKWSRGDGKPLDYCRDSRLTREELEAELGGQVIFTEGPALVVFELTKGTRGCRCPNLFPRLYNGLEV